MAHAARWIRLDPGGTLALHAACAGFANSQPSRAVPAALWARTDDGRFALALIAPLKFAPGRSPRWRAWALAPLVAAYRQFGLRAYREPDGICLGSRRIATCDASAIGECAVVMSSFLPLKCNFMDAYRGRIESQHGWQFDHSWPSAAEREAIADALAGEKADAK